MDPGTRKVPDDIAEQCRLMFANVRRVMAAAGGSPDDIVKLVVWAKDKSFKDAMNKELARDVSRRALAACQAHHDVRRLFGKRPHPVRDCRRAPRPPGMPNELRRPMPQLTLFDSSERLLADDERGRIAYAPGFVDAATAEAWFTELRSGVKWRSERRMMYEREVDVPRLMAHFRRDAAPDFVPRPILDAGARVETDRVCHSTASASTSTATAAIAWPRTTIT